MQVESQTRWVAKLLWSTATEKILVAICGGFERQRRRGVFKASVLDCAGRQGQAVNESGRGSADLAGAEYGLTDVGVV